jgi:hypothetical protein
MYRKIYLISSLLLIVTSALTACKPAVEEPAEGV